jgi:thiopurine S-methyltransferase
LQASFWHERWEKNQLGFHQAEVNALLTKHWPDLEVVSAEAVFVPLCGKSLDMRWLRERGHPVVGVELSPIALGDFFAEAGLEPSRTREGALEHWSAEGFDLYCGDFFDLEAPALANVGGCFDRGSLIALPPDVRRRYAEHLARILPERVRILLLSVEYDQSKMDGPPHSVPIEEVESLFGAEFDVETLSLGDWVEAPPMFQARGLDRMRERVVRLARGGPA